MKEIKVSRNLTASIDDEYYNIVSQYSWHIVENGYAKYAQNGRGGSAIRMHWLIIGQPIKGFVVDHIDRNGLNNTKNNLRVVTYRQNASRTGINKNFPCVHKVNYTSWQAHIRRNAKLLHLGTFQTEFEAMTAYRNNLIANNELLLPEYEEYYNNYKGTK